MSDPGEVVPGGQAQEPIRLDPVGPEAFHQHEAAAAEPSEEDESELGAGVFVPEVLAGLPQASERRAQLGEEEVVVAEEAGDLPERVGSVGSGRIGGHPRDGRCTGGPAGPLGLRVDHVQAPV